MGTPTYLWHFGDGDTSAAAAPLHTYVNTGTFTVTLWITDGVLVDVETKTHYVTVGDQRVISYTYDGLYRLTEADYSSGESFQYAYDSVGTPFRYAPGARDAHDLHRHHHADSRYNLRLRRCQSLDECGWGGVYLE